MANTPNRLGRGLGSLIAGGAGKKTAKAAKTSSAAKSGKVKKKKEKQEAPPAITRKGVVKQGKASQQDVADNEQPSFISISTSLITVSPYQRRESFDERALSELADSIRSEGLMQPITVRKVGEGYELIAGERRLRACRSIGLKKIDARLVSAADSSAAVMSLIENLQRRDLNAIEEALGYASLMEDFNFKQEDVAERVGKPRSSVANFLRLLQLNKECQGYLRKGMLSFGHARALLGLDAIEEQTLLARRIIEAQLSVRDAEKEVARMKQGHGGAKQKSRSLSDAEIAVIENLEQRIASYLNTRVHIKHSAKKGVIQIQYQGNEDLQRLLEKLGVERASNA